MVSFLSKAIIFFIVIGIRFFAKQKGIGKEPCDGNPFFVIAPIAGMIIYQALYALVQSRENSQVEFWVWMVIAAMSFIMLYLSFYPIYAELIRNVQIRKSAAFYMKQLELFKQEKELEDLSTREIWEFRHNIKQQMIYLNNLVEDNNLEDAKAFLKTFIGENSTQEHRKMRTGNLVIDSLVNHAWNLARKKNAICHIEVIPLPELSIKDTDLCVLLGNALDNAMEAMDFVEEEKRQLWISVNYMKGCLLIQIENSYEKGTLKCEHGVFSTGKSGKGHGFGLYSMERIARKYLGSLETEAREETFKVEILIRC